MAFKKDTLKYFWDRLNNLKANREELITIDFENSDEGVSSKNIFNLIYPIGSYYWSKNPTSPNELFGGVWEQVKDTFILAAGDNYEVNTTGGEAEHALTVEEMPIHGGHLTENNNKPDPTAVTNGNVKTSVYFNAAATTNGDNYGWVVNNGNEAYPATLKRGGDLPHNNMPPYRVAYCWCRIG